MTRRSRVGATVLALFAGGSGPLLGQGEGPPTEGSIIVGASRYELPGTGTGFSLNAGLTIPLVRRTLSIEPSLGFLRYTTQFGKHSTYMFPELTLQAERRLGAARPYLGAGLGTGTVGLTGPARWKFTLVALGGVRVHLGGRWGVRGEVRLRSVDPWNGHTADFGVGFTHTSF